ncbi:cytochrome P450 [Laetiporus sulphureus 93-53]|uniref:Cytochrome P450 n=1 Tax=Laetiporus sulphureus 93-53 TaxID=1314785 RepID=A0A165CWG5_9APHY|nr:cytochrome P450 [Laetiporus sulphureus 93-53]KZT03583.1 cytochrome P450 [Laetiporus sulphureus 93-53]
MVSNAVLTDTAPPPSVVLILSLSAFVLYLTWTGYKRASQLPPGPKGLPLLGNVHQLPQDYQERTFGHWAQTYGDIFTAWFFRRPALVISSADIARDLMEKRSAVYSDRPRFVYMAELIGWKAVFVLNTTDLNWRKHRKWLHSYISEKAALIKWRQSQQREAVILLRNLLQDPTRHDSHFQRYMGGIIMEIAYGHIVTSPDDKYIHHADLVMQAVAKHGSPGATPVDLVPALKYLPTWFPGAGFKRTALAAHEALRKMLDEPFEMVENAMASGVESKSFTASIIEEVARQGPLADDDKEAIKEVAAMLHGGKSNLLHSSLELFTDNYSTAGTDTTGATLDTFLLAMVLFPDVHKKAQEEIDLVIGNDRLPNFNDRSSLPYLEAVVKETYRWHTVGPLGVPHQAISDGEYRGYHIAKGTTIIPNVWAMTQDPRDYPEPQIFRPERFLAKNSKTNARDPREYSFGFGRRICPGKDLADSSVWLAIAYIAAALDISKARDDAGREITPPAAFNSGFISHPVHFPCEIRPRSGEASSLMAEHSERDGT